jgi:Uma2 family endonuclease
MTVITGSPPPPAPPPGPALPDHTQLPESDGTFVNNDQEHPQSMLLTDSIRPVLLRRHPDERYCLGQDLGIYWRLAQPPEPLYKGAVAPDWFYVPGVPRTLGGQMRRSYVLWQEPTRPLVLLEFVSGDGAEERDRTPGTGKFWVYEEVIRPRYYGIYEVDPGRVEVYQRGDTNFQPLPANDRGHYPIPELGVELGIWQGRYQEVDLPWLRWWDAQGNLLLTGEERAQREAERAQREAERAERLAAQLRALGLDPET